LKVLVDTSFILPTLGIDVGEKVTRTLEKLEKTHSEIHYSQFSILESLWVTVKLTEKMETPPEAVNTGLRSIIESRAYKPVKENSEIFIEALQLYLKGHRDLIDNILYANSLHHNMKLLTLDNELKSFIENKKLKNTIITPDNILL